MPAPEPDFIQIRAAESRIEFAMAGLMTVLITGTLYYVHSLFSDIVPPERLWLWTGTVIFTVACMIAIPLIVWLRRPSDAEIMAVWSPAGKAVAVLFDTATAMSVWLLLPYASESLRLLMVVFYAAAISGQVISTAESLVTIAYGVVSIFGSTAIFFVMTPGPYSIPLAVFLLAFGGLMLGVAVTLKYAIRSAIVARMKAERVSADLALALDDATAARAAKTRFIAAATHDLRQPLQAAALFFQALVPKKEEDRVAIASAKLAFEEATSLLERLLDHLRLDGGLIEARLAPVALDGLFARLQSELAPLAKASGTELRIAESTNQVLADQQLVTRILRNLVHNAIRHANAGRILLAARRRDACVEIFVIDDGRGIDPAAVASLFVENKPVGATGRGGVGLGLSSSAKMAELNGGSLELVAAWRRGAAFRVRLPACS